ncbi:hypothetical protein Micbo1qcDRAFT_20330 [Microdochium bolleyi]|uniref:Glycosyltransferase 61 catalytic domain-containing protein n=1 Tax=Microdochium bolleyi TaxID=196109 RepID=A0A136IT10_9PEZI|nr:hypothetical protein Micbo1qcDRAFT_20330 [Microdochium bolleyi]
MLLRYPSRSLHVLRTCLLLLAGFAIVRWWHIASSHTQQQPWSSTFTGKIPQDPLAHLDEVSTVTKPDGSPDQHVRPGQPLASTHGNHNNDAGYPPTAQDGNSASSVDSSSSGSNLPLPAEYAAHDPTSDFCASRFTTKWFDVIRANRNQYCLESAASALHCFHTPPDFHGDRHVDSFCIGQNARYDTVRDKFTLDCPLTKVVPPGLPKTPWDLHEYWYETGPRPIMWRWMTLDDRAEILQHRPFKGPPVAESASLPEKATGSGSSSPSSSSADEAQQQHGLPARPTERDIPVDNMAGHNSTSLESPRAAPASASTPRTFTYLLKREGSHNIFHSLHEIMSMTQTFDALRTTRDPATNAPFFVSPVDIPNVQIIIVDGHNDGPYFDLWKLFSGRDPKRVTQLVEGEGKAAILLTTPDDEKAGEAAWLSRPLDNVIIPFAGGSNPVWHDDWEKWDCVNELRTVFVRRVLDFYGFPADTPVLKKSSGLARRQATAGANSGNIAPPRTPEAGSGGSPAAKAAAAVQSPKKNSNRPVAAGGAGRPSGNETSRGSSSSSSSSGPKGSSKAPSGSQNAPAAPVKEAAAATAKNETVHGTQPAVKNDKPSVGKGEKPAAVKEPASTASSSKDKEDSAVKQEVAIPNKDKAIANKQPPPSSPPPSSSAPGDNSNVSNNSGSEALTPPPPGALRITFIDRKETRRVQDTPALLAHARNVLAGKLKLNIHIQAVDFATLSFREQIALARETDILVGVHGAGLTHTLFMRQDMGALVEIFPEGFELRCFRAMARDRGLEYYKMHVPVVEKKADFHVEDVIVPQDKFVEVLEHAVKALDNRPGSFNDFY